MFTRVGPAIAVPVGYALFAQSVWVFGEDYVHGRRTGLGENLFSSLLLFGAGIVGLIGLCLFFYGLSRFGRRTGVVVLLALVVASISIASVRFLQWSNANVESVIEAAEKSAGDEPYCIDVPVNERYPGNDYRAALKRSDFSGYNMRAPHSWGWYAGPHAILAVGSSVRPDLYYWSYGEQSFIKYWAFDKASSGPLLRCSPRTHFARELLDKAREAESSDHIRYAGMYLSIPRVYKSEARLSSEIPALSYYAVAPDFPATSVDAGKDDLRKADVVVHFADTDRTDVWDKLNKPGSPVKFNEELGLHKFVYPNPGAQSFGAEFFNVTVDNKVLSLINCTDMEKGVCFHWFWQGGWTYSFSYSPALLPKWKEMEGKLVKLTHSFVESPSK